MTGDLSVVDLGFVRFGPDGLVPAVLQQVGTDRVLMVGFMNADALVATRATGLVHFWSRSRGRLWRKGESSGNVARVVELRVNCEQNSLLLTVDQVGAICHDGYGSCYYRRVTATGSFEITEPRLFDPADVYGETGAAAPTAPLTSTVRDWFRAYEALRDTDLAAESATSRRLRSGEDLRGRVADELSELAGVIDGTHRHRGFEQDIALEAGQCLYWLALVAVGHRLGAHDIALPDTLRSPGTSSAAGLAGETSLFRALAAAWPGTAEDEVSSRVQVTVAAVARSCRLAGVDLLSLIADDLADLRGKPYLAAHFAALD